jgi:3-methyladenine DNA glycosylase AlkC
LDEQGVFFCDHPDTAIKLLSQLRDDDSDYVRKSVGNALRDISRKHKALVKAELQQWEGSPNGGYVNLPSRLGVVRNTRPLHTSYRL